MPFQISFMPLASRSMVELERHTGVGNQAAGTDLSVWAADPDYYHRIYAAVISVDTAGGIYTLREDLGGVGNQTFVMTRLAADIPLFLFWWPKGLVTQNKNTAINFNNGEAGAVNMCATVWGVSEE